MPVLFVPLGDCILQNERKPNWDAISDVSKELFLRCWENNVYTYKGDYLKGFRKYIVSLFTGSLYFLYYHWKHEKRLYGRLLKRISGINV